MNDKPDFKTKFKCDSCKKIIPKDITIFTKTSYGGKVWLCKECAIQNGIKGEK